MKSNIMYHPQLYNDFNATATHLKDIVNCMTQLQTPLAAKCLLWADTGDVAAALAAVDVMAAADVTNVVDADLTSVADVEAVAMTVVDVLTASQAQPPSDLRTALNKTPLTP